MPRSRVRTLPSAFENENESRHSSIIVASLILSTTELQDLLPNILSQVDPSEFSKLAEHLRPPAGAEADDDIPDLAEDDAPPQAEATA